MFSRNILAMYFVCLDILAFLALCSNIFNFVLNILMFIVFLCSSLMARSRQDEVNKIIEISDVGIYCHQLEEQQDLCHVGLENGHSRDNYLVNPFCVTVSVLVRAFFNVDTVISFLFFFHKASKAF